MLILVLLTSSLVCEKYQNQHPSKKIIYIYIDIIFFSFHIVFKKFMLEFLDCKISDLIITHLQN